MYVEGKFIELGDVNYMLTNALAEIHFMLKHYHIQQPGEKTFDSFTANIEQMNVHFMKITHCTNLNLSYYLCDLTIKSLVLIMTSPPNNSPSRNILPPP